MSLETGTGQRHLRHPSPSVPLNRTHDGPRHHLHPGPPAIDRRVGSAVPVPALDVPALDVPELAEPDRSPPMTATVDDLTHDAAAQRPRYRIESEWAETAKRAIDLAFGLPLFALMVLAFPWVALAVKLTSRGPVLFRQVRIGRGGQPIVVYKFRSMHIDAEARLRADAALHRRYVENGFKLPSEIDPRITAVGRVLRRTSLDELPQLFNVVRRQMSLVGPRPALPAEVATFPADLRSRERVLPGITGLWQAEARDNPSFEAYRRLDLFYVENWSMTLDLLIVLGTLEQIGLKLVHTIARRRSAEAEILVHPTLATAQAAVIEARS